MAELLAMPCGGVLELADANSRKYPDAENRSCRSGNALFTCLPDADFPYSRRMTPARYPLSIVIPIYNEEPVLAALFSELEQVRDEILKPHGPVELVLVNDGSKDRSW